MTAFVSLSRDAFRRGVKDTLELRLLREAAKSVSGSQDKPKAYNSETSARGRSVVVEKSHSGHWHVKKAS